MSISSISPSRAAYSADNSAKVLHGNDSGRLDTTDMRPRASQAAVDAKQSAAVPEARQVEQAAAVTGSMGREVDVYL